MKTVIEMALEAGFEEIATHKDGDSDWICFTKELERFAEIVRAYERERVTNLLLYMHNKAAPYHNYYKHVAVEINRKAGEGEKI